MMKIRLEGTPQECQQAAPLLGEVLDVVSVSDPYPNRGQSRLVRVYVEVRPTASARSTATTRPPRRHGRRSGGPGASCPRPDRHRAAPTRSAPGHPAGALRCSRDTHQYPIPVLAIH